MSLRRSFILVFSALMTALAALAAAFSYYSARNEAWSILDFQLQQIAGVVGDGRGLSSSRPAAGASDEVVAIRIVRKDGSVPMTNDPSVPFPEKPLPGFSTFGSSDAEWRLFTADQAGTTVMVAQRTAERDELAADAAWNSAWPFLLAVPLSWAAAYWLVGAIMERLQIIAAEVEGRAVEDTTPLSLDAAPAEIRPLIDAINRAFDRVRKTLEQQRAFLADAAHEIRTPVTALSLQIGNLKRAKDSDERDAAIADLQSGARRATQVSTQLLKLARSEDGGQTIDAAPITDIAVAVQDCLGRFLGPADAKNIDLGLVHSDSCEIRIEPQEFAAILDVLLDNALRYTPEEGQVDLAILKRGRAACITVTDTGPGIPEALHERVFDRFFRADPSKTEGSGLGLAIARNLAGRYGGTIHLGTNPAGAGLRVTLSFPLA